MVIVMFGHGGTDPGAVKYIIEAPETHETGNQIVARIVELGGKAIGVSSTGDLKTGIANVNKVSKATDIILVVHINAGGGEGVESYYAQGFYSGQTKLVVDGVHSAMLKVAMKYGMKNRGIKSDKTTRYGRLGALQDTRGYAVLVEIGFVDSQFDANLLELPAFEKDLADALARELMRLDNQKVVEAVVKPVIVPKPTPVAPKEYFRVRKSWEDEESQLYAFSELDSAIAIVKAKPEYKVFNNDGIQVYPEVVVVKVEPPLTQDELRRTRIAIKDIK